MFGRFQQAVGMLAFNGEAVGLSHEILDRSASGAGNGEIIDAKQDARTRAGMAASTNSALCAGPFSGAQ